MTSIVKTFKGIFQFLWLIALFIVMVLSIIYPFFVNVFMTMAVLTILIDITFYKKKS